MRGCVKAVLLLLLVSSVSSSAVLADCSWTPRRSAPFRTTALDVAVDGDFVWVATGYGVQLMEGARVVDAVAIPGLTRVVRPAGSGIVYAGSGSRVYALRRDGRNVTVAGFVPASGTVNALSLAGGHLFVGTSNGIDHYDLLDPLHPSRKNSQLATSSPNVTSLAVFRNVLYAADGDATVEMFAIAAPSQPQAIGSINVMPRASAVHVADDLLYVSDRFGQSTEVFTGTSRIATLPVGATSLAALGSRVNFVAGPDRTIRAVDFANANRTVERLELQLAPTNGTDNSIHAMVRAGNTLYVAAGDIGVVTVDTTAITAPYPLVGYAIGPTTSIRVAGNKAYVSDLAGSVTELRIDPNGIAMIEERTWTAAPGSVVRDVRNNGLLTSAGRDITLWALVSTAPTPVATTRFATDVINAVSVDAYMVALLANGSVYTVPPAPQSPQKVNVAPMSLLTRAGSAIATAEIRENEGKTVVHYWPTGDLATAARTFTIEGAAVGTMALDATRAAVFTFQGISVIDLASGAVRVIPGSNAVFPRQLTFSGDDLLALDGRRLHVFENARTLARSQPLPSDSFAVDVSGTIAVLATAEGVAAVSRTRTLPDAVARFRNNYYTKVVAAADRVYLFEKTGIDVFASTNDAPLRYVVGINAPGAIDLAASDSGLFTISGNATLSAWSRAGALLAQRTLNEGPETQPLAIATARGAVWVALSTGCGSGACERKTLVLDPNTLAVTATLAGAVRDVVVSGTRAYALFDSPNELRVLDVSSPLQPAQILAAARPASATSLAYESGRIHVLGDKLYTYNESTLAAQSERFTAVTPDAAQRITIDGGCAVITARGDHPELYTIPTFAGSSALEVPSSVRSVATLPGRLFLLTGHSVEIWSTLPSTNTRDKRRSVR